MPNYGHKKYFQYKLAGKSFSWNSVPHVSLNGLSKTKTKNLVENYIYLPVLNHVASNHSVADQRCYPEFLVILIYMSIHNDNQPGGLTENLLEENIVQSPINYPRILTRLTRKTSLP